MRLARNENSTEMILRPATENDLHSILDIFNYEIVNTPYVYIYEAWTIEYITEWFKQKQESTFPFLVIEIEGKIAGYGYYGKFREREAYDSTVEYSVYIHQDFRMMGIARKIVMELMKRAKAQGVRCFIGGADAANTQSVAFHKKLGFSQVAHIKSVARKFDEWRDLLFFQLVLDE